MPAQLFDNKAIGQRIEEVMAEKRARSRRSFAISVDADPSFFDKIVKGTAQLTEKIANKIEEMYGVNAEWIWTGNAPKIAQGRGKFEPSPMQILASLTEAFKDQAKAMADQAEAFRTQAEIIKNIESKMAMEISLQEALSVVETIADRQGPAIQKILLDLDELKQRKNGP